MLVIKLIPRSFGKGNDVHYIFNPRTQVEENRKFRCHTIHEKAASGVFTNRRSVFDRCTLDVGTYVVIPSTFDPAQEREFFLRLFTERPSHAQLVIATVQSS